MRTNAPKSITWIIAVVIGVLGILGKFIAIPLISVYSFWLLLAGFVILALSTKLRGF